MKPIDSQLGGECLLRTPQLQVNHRLTTRGACVCVCFVVAPSCEPPIDSQLRMCVCVCVFVEDAQLHVDNRLGTRGGVCVCVWRVPS